MSIQRHDRWLEQLKREGVLTLRVGQFLELVGVYNGISSKQFSTEILKKSSGFLHCRTRGSVLYSEKSGFDKDTSKTISNLFTQWPYYEENFWKEGPITLKNTDLIPLIEPSKLPESLSIHRPRLELEHATRNKELIAAAKFEQNWAPNTLSLEESRTQIGDIEAAAPNFPPIKKTPPATMSVEEALDYVKPKRKATSKKPAEPLPPKTISVEEALNNTPVPTTPAAPPVRTMIGSVEASFDDVPNVATDIQYEGKATTQKSNQRD